MASSVPTGNTVRQANYSSVSQSKSENSIGGGIGIAAAVSFAAVGAFCLYLGVSYHVNALNIIGGLTLGGAGIAGAASIYYFVNANHFNRQKEQMEASDKTRQEITRHQNNM